MTCWRRNEGNSVERSTTEDVGPFPRCCKRKRRGWQGGNPAPECVRNPKLNLRKKCVGIKRRNSRTEDRNRAAGPPSLPACSAPTAEMIASARAAALCGSLSSTRCAMRAQLSRLRADWVTSCAKRSSRWIAAASKSWTTSALRGESASGRG